MRLRDYSQHYLAHRCPGFACAVCQWVHNRQQQPGPLRVDCAWCKRTLQDGRLPVSHGICPDCQRTFDEGRKAVMRLTPEQIVQLAELVDDCESLGDCGPPNASWKSDALQRRIETLRCVIDAARMENEEEGS